MASKEEDQIDFSKLEKELQAAVAADEKYWRENDAKFRAINQKVGSYDEFRDMVLAAHLKPLDKKDKIQDTFKQPWNTQASNTRLLDSNKDCPSLQISNKLPTNGHEFARDWRRLGKSRNEQYNFLMQIGGTNLAKIFKAEIGFGLLGEILGILEDYKFDDFVEVISVLKNLTMVNRFSLSLQFLSSAEKEQCQILFTKLQQDLMSEKGEGLEITETTLEDISNKYNVNK